MPFRSLPAAGIAAFALTLAAAPVRAAESFDACAGFIDTVPAIVATQGVWCLRHDIAASLQYGGAITVDTNNVTIDCNGYKLGNLAAGTGNNASGITSYEQRNVTVRGCNIRGFSAGLYLAGGGGHLVEDNRIQSATTTGILTSGDGTIVRRNSVVDTIGIGPVAGISAYGEADIEDNLVDTVASTSGDRSVGIAVAQHVAPTIRGNRVRAVYGPGAPAASAGIRVWDDTSNALIEGNFVSGPLETPAAAAQGVHCYGTTAVVRGNTVVGYGIGLMDCSNDGGNIVR